MKKIMDNICGYISVLARVGVMNSYNPLQNTTQL